MKILILLFILCVPCFACPQVVTNVYGRATKGDRGLPRVSVLITGDDFAGVTMTNPSGYYHLNVTGCSDTFKINATSKSNSFAEQIFKLQYDGQPVNIDLKAQ